MHSKVIIAALVFGLGVGLNVGVKNNASASHGLVKDGNCDVVEHVECDHDHEHEHVYQKNLQINRAPASSTVRPDLFITRSRTGSFNGGATWYTFTAPFEGRFWFESTSSNVDPIAQIYLGPNTSYSTVSVDAGNRDDISSSNRNFRFALDMHTAETYYIQVREYYNRTGSYTIRAYHNHDYTYRSTYYTSTTHKKFCSCGEYTTASLNVDDTMDGHGRNMVHCANCDTWIDLIPSDHTHSYSTCSYNSQNYHRWICDCGATYLAAHSYDSTYNIGDYQVKHCSVCNAWVEVLRPHTHSYTNSYTYVNDGKHNANCSCGQSIKQVHTFDSYLPYGHGHNDMIHCSKCNVNVELGVLSPGSTLSGSIPNDGAKWHIFKPESSGRFTFSLASSSDARMDFYYGQYPTSVTDTFHTENIGRVSFTRTVNGGENVFIRVTENNWGPASYSLTVTRREEPAPQRSWTVMIYMCGSNSLTNAALDDIEEILSVNGQPNDVSIILEVGGARYWPANSFGLERGSLKRYTVSNNTLVPYEGEFTYGSMGAQNTFEEFLNWGLTQYPAEKTGVILWNHGGGLDGVCFDNNFEMDPLLNSEVNAAFDNVLANNNITSKLEFIGYDACLMQMQDVAEFNSEHFKYMVGSQELEGGDGWEYDMWVDNLYRKESTTSILYEIADTYVQYSGDYGDGNLSVLDLSKMANYYNEFEILASQMSEAVEECYDEFIDIIENTVSFADGCYDDPGSIDAFDFLIKLENDPIFSAFGSQIYRVKQYFQMLMLHCATESGAVDTCGLSIHVCIASNQTYEAGETHFQNWRSLFF